MSRERIGLLSGTGEEGRGLALRMGQGGLSVSLGSRSAERAAETAAGLNLQLGGDLLSGAVNEEVAARCTMLFLTMPFAGAESLLRESCLPLGPDHLIVDVTVPLSFKKGPELLDLGGISGAEHLRTLLDSSIPLAAAFKTVPAHLLVDLQSNLDCDEFLCYDSDKTRDRLLPVLEQIEGIRWVDAGPLSASRSLEAMTLLAIQLNRRYKSRHGRYRFLGLKSEIPAASGRDPQSGS